MARHFTLLIILLGLSLTAYAQAQQSKLPPCPSVDYSKNTHIGIVGRTGKWHNCFGRYALELNDSLKGDLFEGEFQNGLPNGQGSYFFLANNQFKGDKYVGEFKDGKYNGLGSYTYANGDKYVGEFKDGKYNYQHTYTFNNNMYLNLLKYSFISIGY